MQEALDASPPVQDDGNLEGNAGEESNYMCRITVQLQYTHITHALHMHRQHAVLLFIILSSLPYCYPQRKLWFERNFCKCMCTWREKIQSDRQKYVLTESLKRLKQLKAMPPLFFASLGTDTEQTDPCDYILRGSKYVCTCRCTVCRVGTPVFGLYTSIKYADMLSHVLWKEWAMLCLCATHLSFGNRPRQET